MKKPTIDIGRDVYARVVVTVIVHNRRVTRVRFAIGIVLFKFAGWVTGFKTTLVERS